MGLPQIPGESNADFIVKGSFLTKNHRFYAVFPLKNIFKYFEGRTTVVLPPSAESSPI